MTDTRPRTFTVLTEHPLPLDEDEVTTFAENHPQLDPDIHVDVLHEDYITWPCLDVRRRAFEGVYSESAF